MATKKIYTPKEIDDIHLTKSAVIGKEYKDTRGLTFIGFFDNVLRLKDTASNTVFSPSIDKPESNLQDVINGINVLTQQVIYFDNNQNLSAEGLYVSFSDTKVRSNSIITAYVSVDSTRDPDELEFTDFVCTAVNIVPGVSYEILVVDQSLQAEDRYILNVIRN